MLISVDHFPIQLIKGHFAGNIAGQFAKPYSSFPSDTPLQLPLLVDSSCSGSPYHAKSCCMISEG